LNRARRNESAYCTKHPVPFGVHRRFLAKKLQASEDKCGAKDISNPMKMGQEGGADRDENSAEDKRSDHSPEQHAMLISWLNSEIREDDSKDEQIVNRQCFLDQIAGQKLKAALWPEVEVQKRVE